LFYIIDTSFLSSTIDRSTEVRDALKLKGSFPTFPCLGLHYSGESFGIPEAKLDLKTGAVILYDILPTHFRIGSEEQLGLFPSL